MTSTSPTWLPTYSRNRISRRRFLAGAASGAAAATLIACGGGSSGPERISIDPSGSRVPGAVIYGSDEWKLASETKDAVPGGTFVRRLSNDLSESWDPWLATQGDGDAFTDLSYEYAVRPNVGPGIDPNSPEGQGVVPHLAENFEVSDDATTFTFTMRRGVKYQPLPPVNGREMNIDDWRSSWANFLDHGANRPAFLEVGDKVEFPDARHMVIKMKSPYAPFLARMWDYNFGVKIVPKELNEDKNNLLQERMVGTGMIMVDKVQPSIDRQFKAFPGYWQGKPLIDRWHWVIIPETANAYAQFLAQNVYSHGANARDALNVRKDAPQAIMSGSQIDPNNTDMTPFGREGFSTSPWKDARVRIALHRAVPWDEWLEFSSNRAAFRAAGVEVETSFATHVPWNQAYYLDPRKGELGDHSKNFLYDVAEAKKLMAAAGYADGFEMDYYTRLGSAADLYSFHHKSLRELIKVNDIGLTRQEHGVKVISQGSFGGMSFPQTSSGTDIDYIIFRNWAKGGPNTPTEDPKMDQLAAATRKELDPVKRAERIKDFQRYAAETFYTLPGQHRFNGWSFQWPWLHNVNAQKVNRASDNYLLWLDPNMPRRNG